MKIFPTHRNSKHSNLPSARALYARRITHDPYIDWEVLIVLTFLMSLMSMGLGAWLYYATEAKLSEPNTVLSPKKISFDQGLLISTLTEFDDRSRERTTMLRSGYTGPGDPSI